MCRTYQKAWGVGSGEWGVGEWGAGEWASRGAGEQELSTISSFPLCPSAPLPLCPLPTPHSSLPTLVIITAIDQETRWAIIAGD